MKKRIFSLFLLLSLGGCTDPLTKLVNSKFPPVTTEEQRAAAINTTADALARVHIASLGVGVSLPDASAAVFTDALRAQGITKLTLDGDKQLLRLTISFDRTFTEADAVENQDVAKLLRDGKPRLQGNLTIFAGLAGEVATPGSAPIIELRLLPAVETINITKIELSKKYDVTLAGAAIVALLNKYKDNISGELTRSTLTHITVPAMADRPVDFNKTFEVKSGSAQAAVITATNPVTVPFRVESIAWLVADNHLDALVQLTPIEAPPTQPTAVVNRTFEAIKDRFASHVKDDLAVPNADRTWIAIRKDVVAAAMNSLVRQAALCVSASAEVPNQHSETQIKLPDGMGIDCTPTKECSPRQCSFESNHDTRNCSACLVHNPFGGCVVRGNDPFCEAAKATQNAIYTTDANLRKADCDRLAAQEKLSCEVEKSATKLLCETKKEALNALARTGKFANLDVDASMKTNDMKVCLRDFTLSPAIDRVQFALDVQGSASAKVNVKFVPLDIVGHLTCVMDWSKEQTFNASLRDSRVGISSDIHLITDQSGARAAATLAAIPIKARLDPGPTEFLLKSPELLVKCPVLAAIAPTMIALTPFVPQLKGDIDYTLPVQDVSIKLELPEQDVAGKKLTGRVAATPVSLVVSGLLTSK
jgi:hypothetical protein